MLYVDRAHAVDLEEGRYFISDLLGCRVQDRQGNALGTVENVLQPASQRIPCLLQLPVSYASGGSTRA